MLFEKKEKMKLLEDEIKALKKILDHNRIWCVGDGHWATGKAHDRSDCECSAQNSIDSLNEKLDMISNHLNIRIVKVTEHLEIEKLNKSTESKP
jgi:hypothetical protein